LEEVKEPKDSRVVELISSPREMEDFIMSPGWTDIKNQITVWLEDVRDTLEDPDNILLDRTLHRLGGNAESLRRVLALPSVTLASLIDGIKEI